MKISIAVLLVVFVVAVESRYRYRYYGNSGMGFAGYIKLARVLFPQLFRRPSYRRYNNYGNYNYYYNRGYCRVSQLVDYVGRTPRYYCDCAPYPPNYQWNYCSPMYALGK